MSARDPMRAVKPRELRDLYRAAADAGCTVELTRGDHVRVTTPQGRPVFGSQTASDHRAVRNIRAKLRRAGLDMP